MKNIRRLIIALTFAVMAMVMMTAVSFADDVEFTLTAGNQEIEMHRSSVMDNYNWQRVYYGYVSDPSPLKIEGDLATDESPYDDNWNSPSVSWSGDGWLISDMSGYYADRFGSLNCYSDELAEEMGIDADTPVYCMMIMNSDYAGRTVFLIEPPMEVPVAEIKECEQLDDNSVSISFEGEGLDFGAAFRSSWLNGELKTENGEVIPIQTSAEVIDATHVKLSYSVDKSYEPNLGKDPGSAVLTVTYKGALEPKVFDVTLPASSYWSKYAEQPEKITKGDKDWPEFVGYYKISTPEELAWFAGLVNGELEGVAQNNQAMAFLADDIVLNDTEGWEDWNESTPGLKFFDCTIGKAETTINTGRKTVEFKGVFDGNYHSIKGLVTYPDPTVTNYTAIMDIALFPVIENAEIRNLSIEESYISLYKAMYNGSRVGGIVSDAKQSVIENCSFKGHVAGNGNQNNYVAGIACRINDGTITNCFNAGLVESKTSSGEASGISWTRGTFENCYNVGTVVAPDTALSIATGGGGYPAVYSNLISCYSTGTCALTTVNGQTSKCFYLDGATEIVNAEKLTEEEFKDGTLLESLASEAYCADDGNKNNGYPILVWQSDLFQAKRAAVKEVKYHLDSDNYGLSKKDLEEAIEMAVESIESASDLSTLNEVKTAAIAALDQFKTDADIQSENADEIARLKAELAKIQAKIEMQDAKVKVAKASVVANGKAQTPAVTVTGKSGAVLKEGTDYTVSYKNNVKPGVATVTVTGTSETDPAVKTATFKILPKKAALKKVKAAKKKLTVTWKKDADVTGYELQYSLKKNFKGAKTVKVAKAGTTKKVIKKLKSKKKYFVRIRSYKTSGKTMLYGAWSKAKSAKVK